MFNKTAQKKVKLIKKNVECCQCWKSICTVYIKPEEEENYRNGYHLCGDCFVDLCGIKDKIKNGEELTDDEKRFLDNIRKGVNNG